ncbi:MAG: nucleotide-diphospho-sugar transferase [SAR324 cluster bacterium]|uniref:Nucleotide-diphospho-sugar transferase n=1 Tax=SAR324 cluster bacterium TaxID=2024889 RepID=A0A2A4T3H7_9DELT|nr:MAG: nucleotide-diphospho-sugar transferase [SAR324 cluster bacterium]
MCIEKFTPPHPLNTAVLFLVFNRLDTTKQVFEAIRQVEPPRLYIAADGAREAKEGEEQKVKEVRNYITSNIDWECEVKTLFREQNLGCKLAVSGSIDWFFENEEMGIILEDDCLPSKSFFWFCEELLKRYKDDMRIWHIAGNNFHFGWNRDEDYSYYFSYYGSIWGWASWKNRWSHYDVKMKNYDEIKSKNYLWDVFGNQAEADFRISNFDEIKNGKNTWDFQWAYTRFINSGLSIVPEVNLVRNLGFGEDATHTHSKNDRRANMNADNVHFPLKHQAFIIRDKKSDDKFFNEFVKSNHNIFKKIAKKVLRK